MKTIVKKLLAGLLCAGMLLALAACGDSPASSDPASEPDQEPPLPASLVSFSAKKPSASFFGDENLTYDAIANYYIGSNVAGYISAYIQQLFGMQQCAFNCYAQPGSTISRIKQSVVSKCRNESADLIVILLSDKDAQKYAETNDEQYAAAAYKTAAEEMLTAAAEKASCVALVGPFTLSGDEAVRTAMADYAAAAEQACQVSEKAVYIPCQAALDEWAKQGEITLESGSNTVLNANTQMRLAADVIQTLHMTSLNKRQKTDAVKNFTADFVIVTDGDSITDAGRDQTITKEMNLGTGYPSLMKAYLLAEYGEQAPTVYNAAHSGYVAAQMSSSFRREVEPLQPNYLIIMVGINDAYSQWELHSNDCSPEKYANTMKKLMHDFADAYDKVLFISPYYVDKPESSTQRIEYVNDYITALKAVAEEYSNAQFLDFQSMLDARMDEIGYTKSTTISPDKAHLTIEGHRLLLTAVLDALGI